MATTKTTRKAAAPKTTKTSRAAKVTKTSRATIKRISPIRTQTTDDNMRELVLVVPPVKVPKFAQGFIDFVRTQGVVGLAVGLVLGVAAKSVVDSLVANIFNPIIGLIGADGGSLDGKFICLRHATNVVNGEQFVSCTNKLGYGNVISNLISFMIVAGVVYFVVKGLKLDKLDKPKA